MTIKRKKKGKKRERNKKKRILPFCLNEEKKSTIRIAREIRERLH